MSENIHNRCPNCARLERKIAVLQKRVAQLEQLLIEATRANKRQAAPFSKAKPKTNPQKPGRKAGPNYGTKAHRQPPDSQQQIDEFIEVPLPNECPDCGGPVDDQQVVHQFQVEIPRRPIHIRFDIHVGRCRRCGKRIQARHPRQCSDALGAASSQIGPDTQSMVASLKSRYGLSYGKISAILKDHFGITLSRGGAVQVVHRTARRSEPVYQAIRQVVRESPVVYPDETGWKIGGHNHWLWTFVTKDATIYVIRPSRGHEVAEEILGADWNGIMVHDGWSPYDFFDKARHQQCLGHLLNRSQELLHKAVGRARQFPQTVKDFLHRALNLRDRWDEHSI
ncbi:MAG: IS66 family transposase, partial [Sedimentisphaerales bacterium]